MNPNDEERGSVTRWVGDLVASADQAAFERLWGRYFEQLVRIARAKLQQMGQPGADAEDAALSALHNFHRAATGGGTADLRDRADLWRLLVTITARKAHDHAEREGRQKRGGGRRNVGGEALEQILAPTPTAEFVAMMAEEHDRLLDALGDETLRRLARLRFEGYTLDEIADELGCARRTVANKLELIRKRWEQQMPA